MTTPQLALDMLTLAESHDLECKAAQGRDGRGELPEDFWRSYSAMANGEGGVILLGVQEKPRGQFRALGLVDVERVRKALWDNLHNRKQVSINLLQEADVAPLLLNGVTVLRVQVPRANRQHKPVHLDGNPFGGTYLRRHEGDYPADDEAVRRMLAERVEDARDDRVLKGFGLDDLDMDTVAAYRNRFAAAKPGHVWTDLPVDQFLERIGAWGKNREEGTSGLRVAGLLMFGRAEVIRDALPHYMVDYQERPDPKSDGRWVDRLVPDGSWSGNVYDFFRKVYQKLTADLKVPFQLHAGQRVDDTPVHEALREALANTLIHAVYTGRMSVLVVKRPDMFGFRNPGRMRVPPDVAIQGGHSDCRNRRLQTMFQLVGYGDHAGSGLPKIYKNWAGQHWRSPTLYELPEPEQTRMELRMSSLVPEQVIDELTARLGARFTSQPEAARLALITAQVEGVVSHNRLKQVTIDHPADLTKMLGTLVREELLVPDGTGRGMVYFLPWQRHRLGTLFDLLEPTRADSEPPEQPLQPPDLRSRALEVSAYLAWEEVPSALQEQLLQLAQPIRAAKKVKAPELQATILNLCKERFLGRHVLAHALGRNADDLLKRTLKPMVTDGLLKTAHGASNDPRQAYSAA